MAPPEAPQPLASDAQRQQSLEAENRKLVDRLAEVTAERDSLKAGRPSGGPCPTPQTEAPPAVSSSSPVPATPEVPSVVPATEPSRIAIVVEGEEPGRVIEVHGDESPAPGKPAAGKPAAGKEATSASKRKSTSTNASTESSAQKR